MRRFTTKFGRRRCACSYHGDVILVRGFRRQATARGRLRRSLPQGRETSRPAGTSPDQIRSRCQPQDRKDSGAYRSALASRPCRRGDRVGRATSAIGASRHLAALRQFGRLRRQASLGDEAAPQQGGTATKWRRSTISSRSRTCLNVGVPIIKNFRP